MYLKRLDMLGFKSFAVRTQMEFSTGITAVVGPNGAGKSNVADASALGVGEQSMRQLRGKKSDDIIFAGGHGKAPLGMAEVSLTLDNSTGWVPSEYSEITVTSVVVIVPVKTNTSSTNRKCASRMLCCCWRRRVSVTIPIQWSDRD